MKTQIINGDCLEVLRTLADNSLDSLVTDPPAGISFMGKAWDDDKGGRDHWIAWLTEVMRECYRVLKPGAHGVVWALPRTSHWTATALENAGFEIRDVVTHLFGTGFPKSLDISKAIDKAAGATREVVGVRADFAARQNKERKAVAWTGAADGGFSNPESVGSITAPATDDAKRFQGWGTALKPAHERWILCRKPTSSGQSEKTGTCSSSDVEKSCSNIESSWSTILGALFQPESKSIIATPFDLTTELRILRSLISATMHDITTLAGTPRSGEPFDANAVLKNLRSVLAKSSDLLTLSVQSDVSTLADICAASIRLWQVSDSVDRMAPSSEDYVLIRKPLSEKAVAANVLKHGTGGINVDGCRVEGAGSNWSIPDDARPRTSSMAYEGKTSPNSDSMIKNRAGAAGSSLGRFPANLVLSHNEDCEDACSPNCAVAMLDEQSGDRPSGGGNKNTNNRKNGNTIGHGFGKGVGLGIGNDTGGASRFFYCAKASKSDRNRKAKHVESREQTSDRKKHVADELFDSAGNPTRGHSA